MENITKVVSLSEIISFFVLSLWRSNKIFTCLKCNVKLFKVLIKFIFPFSNLVNK